MWFKRRCKSEHVARYQKRYIWEREYHNYESLVRCLYKDGHEGPHRNTELSGLVVEWMNP